MRKNLNFWNDPWFLGFSMLCFGVLISIGIISYIDPRSSRISIEKRPKSLTEEKSKSSNERKSTNYNMCMSTDTGKDYYRLGVRSGNEDSQVYRDCKGYYDSFVKPQLSSSEGNGIVTIGCFCEGYNSISKSY